MIVFLFVGEDSIVNKALLDTLKKRFITQKFLFNAHPSHLPSTVTLYILHLKSEKANYLPHYENEIQINTSQPYKKLYKETKSLIKTLIIEGSKPKNNNISWYTFLKQFIEEVLLINKEHKASFLNQWIYYAFKLRY